MFFNSLTNYFFQYEEDEENAQCSPTTKNHNIFQQVRATLFTLIRNLPNLQTCFGDMHEGILVFNRKLQKRLGAQILNPQSALFAEGLKI